MPEEHSISTSFRIGFSQTILLGTTVLTLIEHTLPQNTHLQVSAHWCLWNWVRIFFPGPMFSLFILSGISHHLDLATLNWHRVIPLLFPLHLLPLAHHNLSKVFLLSSHSQVMTNKDPWPCLKNLPKPGFIKIHCDFAFCIPNELSSKSFHERALVMEISKHLSKAIKMWNITSCFVNWQMWKQEAPLISPKLPRKIMF